MGKIKNFMSKPITWGDYFKLCGGAMAASAIMYSAVVGYIFWETHKSYKALYEDNTTMDDDNIINFDCQ